MIHGQAPHGKPIVNEASTRLKAEINDFLA